MEKLLLIEKNGNEFLVDSAYQIIREAIINNKLKPGTVLSEADLSRQLGISRTPTREALKRLEEQNLVKIIPKKGAFVTDLTAEMIHEIYQVREALECYAIRFVPQFGSPEELKKLYDDVLCSEEWIKNNENEKIDNLDIHLHGYIINSSHNELLVKTVNQLMDQITRLRRMTPNFPGRLQEQREEHIKIIKALIDGDVDEARRQLCNHLRKVADTALQIRLKMWQR